MSDQSVTQNLTPSRRGRTFESLTIRNYRLYSVGQGVSSVGTWMQNIAIGWLTLQLSHSGSILGIVTGVRFLPVLLFGPWGGLVADRWERRRLLTLTQVAMAVISGLLALLSGLALVTLPLLIVLVVLLGVVAIFDNPVRQSLISELVDQNRLANAVAVNSMMVNTAKLVGPGLAGVLIAAVGVTPCFVVNAISFATVLIGIAMMNSDDMFPAEREVRAPGQIRAGLRAVGSTPSLLYPMLMVVITGIFTWEFPVTLPLMTTYAFGAGPTGYGVAMACMSVGAVAGGLIAAHRQRHSVRSLSVSALFWAVELVLAAIAPNLSVECVVLVLVGIGSVTFNSSAKTLLQLEAPPSMRGRVMSLWSIGWQGGTVIGAPLVGVIGATAGPRYAMLVGGLAAAGAAAGSLLAARRVRRWNVDAGAPQPQVSSAV